MELKRTKCDCMICKKNCMVIPGYLIPEDISVIQKYLNDSQLTIDFCKTYFLASPGALVMKENKIFRIPTIVPTRRKNSYCLFFDNNEKCLIHEVSPFGCRYFDHSQSKQEGDKISIIGLNKIIQSQFYREIWFELKKCGLIGKNPENLRKEINNG